MLWWHWSILGLSLIGVEILTLGGLGNFYFLFFGMAALMVSGLTWSGLLEAAWLQWFLFAILGVISLLVMKKSLWNKKRLKWSCPTERHSIQICCFRYASRVPTSPSYVSALPR